MSHDAFSVWKRDLEGINICVTINQVSKPSDCSPTPKTFGHNKMTSSKRKRRFL